MPKLIQYSKSFVIKREREKNCQSEDVFDGGNIITTITTTVVTIKAVNSGKEKEEGEEAAFTTTTTMIIPSTVKHNQKIKPCRRLHNSSSILNSY